MADPNVTVESIYWWIGGGVAGRPTF